MKQQEDKVADFLDDIVTIYKKHGLALGHEDSQGAFLVEPYSIEHEKWVCDAIDRRIPKISVKLRPCIMR